MKLRSFFTYTTYATAFIGVVFFISACGADLFVDTAGSCVTCTYASTATESELVITACADGDGNLTITENGSSTISENNLDDFRLPHEASGASCR